MTLSKYLLAGAMAAWLSSAHAAPYPRAGIPAARDLGPLTTLEAQAPITVTVALALSHPDELQKRLEATYTQGTPQYHQFLTAQQFREQFGPSAQTLASLTHYFEAAGLTVTRPATAQLQVTGTPAAIERAFAVQLHGYSVAASAETSAYQYRAALSPPHLDAAIAASVHGVFGLDTRPHLVPHMHAVAKGAATKESTANSGLLDPFGALTVVDFARYYDVSPLYRQGVDGHGRTIGIMTFAAFTPSDAYTYWNSLGLNVAPHRIKEVRIDGGSGPPSDDSGSFETTLDVEQSGGIAPGAKINVYEGPNTDQAFIDVFAAAIDANEADTISTSWGEWELFDSSNPFGNGPLYNPVTGTMTSTLTALNDLLQQAALQGQSAFAAAGDAGAWDEVGELPPGYSNVISVDDPAAQPLLTAAGGTTLPGKQVYSGAAAQLPPGVTVIIDIPQERVWGWDYLKPLCEAQGFAPPVDITCGLFPAGGGGGVSLYMPRPFYQQGIAGMADTVRGQDLIFSDPPSAPQLIAALPAGFAGRNVPDLSVNADPQTGYVVAYTSNVTGFSFQEFWGGTSFSSPQLNGVTSLLSQGLQRRVGLLNVPLYQLKRFGGAYSGAHAPLREITSGDNWYWSAHAGYNQGTGLGVPDVANLLEALHSLDF
jgi:subtilase family serine protease